MNVDKTYCSSSFLMYRRIIDKEKCFNMSLPVHRVNIDFKREIVCESNQLLTVLREKVKNATKNGKVALALSGGIDSAILAKLMPGGATAYTFKCIVPGVKVIDETKKASEYARECGLNHKIIEINWDDMIAFSPVLMEHKGAPIHSIEVQIFKAAIQAIQDGNHGIIFGESADCLFGGLSDLLSKDWLFGDFVERYMFVNPVKVLKRFCFDLTPFNRHCKDGRIDPHDFISNEFFPESIASYINASETAGIQAFLPYSECKMGSSIDYARIRSGENKYLVREVFKKLYPGWEIPKKTPMPRPMDEWLKNWQGPTREEFWPHCTDNMTGDQKYYVWILEKFLNYIEKQYAKNGDNIRKTQKN